MDGLSSQAVYLIDERELILCPGFLLETLKGGSLDPVSLVFGHELGHAADALASDPKSPVQLPLLDRYKGFFSCIDRNYSSELKSFASAKKYVTETGFPALKTYLAQLESANPRNNEEIVRIKRSIQVITGYVATLPTAEQDFNAMFPPSPTPAQSHAGELTADLMATESAAQLLLRVEHSNRAASLAKQLRHNCDNDPTLYRLKVIYGNPVDDGTHPPGKFRIENTLRSPKIREALGCAKKSIPGQPWCSMESR
jgi:hypothetical protein